MLRRELMVPPGLWSQADLAAHAGAAPGLRVEVLRDEDGYARLVPGAMLDGGDRVVLYAFDPASDDDLFAVNAGFAGYYVEGREQPWPDELAAIALTLPARGADVLEICCGAGRSAPAMVRDGNRVTAIDLSADCIRRAAARGGAKFLVADATRLPFAEGSFDVGICLENSLGVFFSRRARVLAELIRVSRHKLVLGLREVPGVTEDELQVYDTRAGHIELAQVSQPIDKILDSLPAEIGARLGERRWLDGGPRPWGGRERYLVLNLV